MLPAVISVILKRTNAQSHYEKFLIHKLRDLEAVRFTSTAGLASYSAAATIGATSLMVAAAQATAPLSPWLFVIAVLVVNAGVTLTWLSRRRLPHFRRNEIGILISVRTNADAARSPDSERILRGLLHQMQVEAAKATTQAAGVKVRVLRLADHHVVRDFETAKHIMRRSKAIYAIWAPAALDGMRAGARTFDLKDIHFAVLHRSLEQKRAHFFAEALLDVQELPPSYRVRHDNDTEDIHVVGTRLGLAAKYHVGLAAAASGWRSVALPLLEECASSGDEYKLQKRARREVAALRIMYWKGIERWPMPDTAPEIVREALRDARLGLTADRRNVSGYSLAANCEFILGNVEAARAASARLQHSSVGEYHLQQAVFALHRGAFDEALGQYNSARKRHFAGSGVEIDSLVQSVLPWLGAAADCMGPNFAFGVAYIADEIGDEVLAAECYREILSLLPDRSSARKHVVRRLQALRAIDVPTSVYSLSPPPD